MTSIKDNLNQIQAQIINAADSVKRSTADVHLLAVSKGQSVLSIQEAYACGLRDFGENYWQEASKKIEALSAFDIHWHFLGHIQGNKLKHIARHFDWVHSVSREAELLGLSAHRPETCLPLQVCLEVNIPGSLGKNGVREADLPALVVLAKQLPKLCCRGLMVIADPLLKAQDQQRVFEQAHGIMIQLNQSYGCGYDTLSMGMSGDFIPAIRAGSTWVRIGQALFGERHA